MNTFSINVMLFLLTGSLSECYAQSSGIVSQKDTIELADPTIFYDKGEYYLYGTGSASGFPVYTSKNLTDWKIPGKTKDGLALTKGNSYGTGGFWAPQIFKYKKMYYMAYTADENIAIAKSKSPLGPFKQTVITKVSGKHKQIDPYVFIDDDGSKYLYHVELNNGNRIYVSKLKDDLSDVIPGTEIECISGELGWENTANQSGR